MWDFFQTVHHRHSIRCYQADMPVEEEKLHAVLETAVAAPSAGDLQSYCIITVTDALLRRSLSNAAYNQKFLADAPVSLVFCAQNERCAQKYGERGRSLYAIQDATIAAAYAQLAVVAAGLGSTWVGFFDEHSVTEILRLEPGVMPIAILCIGYPAELPQETPRKRLDDIVSWR